MVLATDDGLGPMDEFAEAVLPVLADMLTLPLPQQAMVLSSMLGFFVGAAMEAKGISKREALDWVLAQLRRQIDAMRPN